MVKINECLMVRKDNETGKVLAIGCGEPKNCENCGWNKTVHEKRIQNGLLPLKWGFKVDKVQSKKNNG